MQLSFFCTWDTLYFSGVTNGDSTPIHLGVSVGLDLSARAVCGMIHLNESCPTKRRNETPPLALPFFNGQRCSCSVGAWEMRHLPQVKGNDHTKLIQIAKDGLKLRCRAVWLPQGCKPSTTPFKGTNSRSECRHRAGAPKARVLLASRGLVVNRITTSPRSVAYF